MKRLGIGEVRAHLTEIIDDGAPVTITKRGRPVAVLTPIQGDALEAIALIRGMRTNAARLSMNDIVATTRSGRR